MAPEFSPDVVVAVKALARELPTKADPPPPLARWQCPDRARAAVESGLAASISGTTIWRWLSSDAIKPWQHRSWIFPRDPDFAAKAARVLDLYGRRFHDTPLRPDEYVICADEKTSIQARSRKHATTGPAPRRPLRVERGVSPRRLAGLPGRLGRAPRQGVRPLRSRHRHRPIQRSRRPGHDQSARRLCAPSVLGGRQRLLPPRPAQHRPTPAPLANPAP